MKIIFDASLHLGQFCSTDEKIRIACKNSQILISTKPDSFIIGVESFEENSLTDHIVWGLDRNVQDTFYKFMDVFHSVKYIERIPLSIRNTIKALEISKTLHIDISKALTCAIAISHDAQEIHTLYSSLHTREIKDHMKINHGIDILIPYSDTELCYKEEDLENYYQNTFKKLQKGKIDLLKQVL